MNDEDSLTEAFETSLDAAIEAGTIDPTAQAALIVATRKLAQSIDDDRERSANVKFPVFLKYLGALGMLPELDKAAQGPDCGRLQALIESSKFAKAKWE